MNVLGFEAPRCAALLRSRGLDGDDRAEVVFSISASAFGAPNGDSDGDSFSDVAEVCGIDQDLDGVVDIDLKGMGASPTRRDVFVEIDWMVNNTGDPTAQHSHEPWLPALINAWHELNDAPVAYPSGPPGVALHVDVGTLYRGYAMDFNGDGSVDYSVPPSGDIDVDNDGIPDIGNLGALGTGTAGGGNRLPENSYLIGGIGPGSQFQTIKSSNFNPARAGVFHYAVFGHQYASNGSSGLAEACAFPTCDDLLVTLGVNLTNGLGGAPFVGWNRQTVDANGDGLTVPLLGEPGAALLRGPSGLPVDGDIVEHAGTFLHELGHNFGLGHGGVDGVNYKPNYLSIMNYAFQLQGVAFDFNGDLLADSLGVDYDQDGILDVRRLMYSDAPLAELNENILVEPVGIGAPNKLTTYSCPPRLDPPPPPSIPPVPTIRTCSVVPTFIASGSGAIDWDCDGDSTERWVAADINFFDSFNQLCSTTRSRLRGNNDSPQIAQDISPRELRDFMSATRRITAVADAKQALERCSKPETIDFDEVPAGSDLSTQYSPRVTFLEDDLRKPIANDDRGGAPTVSPKNSLRNELKDEALKTNAAVPLVIEFETPQRQVTLYTGRPKTNSHTKATRVVLQAFDTAGLNMGEITKPLANAEAGEGIREFFGAAAIRQDQLIKRIELRYESLHAPSGLWGFLREPQEIDKLSTCQSLASADKQPGKPTPRKFGDAKVELKVNAVMLTQGSPVDNEEGHYQLVKREFEVPVIHDGSAEATDFAITKPEGSRINLTAQPSAGGGRFRNWQLDDRISFGTNQTDLTLTLLRPGTLTAVYIDEKAVHDRPREKDCGCHDDRCCSNHGENHSSNDQKNYGCAIPNSTGSSCGDPGAD